MENYIIQYGDTLKKIAKEKLGNEERWYEIAQLNNLQSPYQLYIGEKIKLPNRISMFKPQPPVISVEQQPATMSYARGFMFVVFEQLPTIGSDKVVRKIAAIEVDFSKHPDLSPKNSFSSITEVDHALGNNQSRFLSASNKPYGSPTNVIGEITTNANKPTTAVVGKSQPVIIDLNKLPPGTRIVSETELLTLLEQKMEVNPHLKNRITTLMNRIKNVEGELLIEGSVPKNAVKKVSNVHSAYILTAEELTTKRALGLITEAEYLSELKSLTKSYERLKIVGRAGRVITVIGVVFTAVELAEAGQKSYAQNSFKPIAAESIRQVGGWGGAIAGGEIGFLVGAALGIESGPGLFVTGAIGAIIFGAAGYAGADWVADWVDDNSIQELRKDVNYVENMKNTVVELTIGADETQYAFCNRALKTAAVQAQNSTLLNSDTTLPARFANKFFPPNENVEEKKKFNMIWEGRADADRNKNKILDPTEWENMHGRKLTYHLNEEKVNELIKMLFGLTR